MEKSMSRNLFFASVGLFVIAIIAIGIAGSKGGALSIVGLLFDLLAIIALSVSTIGALVKTAQLQRWGWFFAILLTGGIGYLIYVFGGPTTKRA